MNPITIHIPGDPEPGGSKTAFALRNRAGAIVTRPSGAPIINMTDANPKAAKWKKTCATCARQAYRGEPLDEPLRVEFVFTIERPKSVKPSARPHPTVKPDCTKLIRPIEDALTGIIWRDDALIIEQSARKVYGFPPCATVIVTRLVAEQMTLAGMRQSA